jgi:RNA polymerase sigma-70 factor (ECF subfamily)
LFRRVRILLDPIVNEIDEAVSTVATSLLNRACADDQASWSLLVDSHAPLVYGWCRRRGLSADEALDVGQEVFVAVAKNLERFSRERDYGTFRGWLRTISENKIRDHWRRNNRQPVALGAAAESIAENDDDSEQTLNRSDSKAVLVQILAFAKDRIKQLHWDVFWEVVVEEKPPDEVARKYGIKRPNVYMIKSRVLRMLREIASERSMEIGRDNWK